MNIAKVISDQGLDGFGRYYSIYEGIVTDNEDPSGLNRLKVLCTGINSGLVVWANPRNQHGGYHSGFKSITPDIGDLVYVTFIDGNVSQALWEYHGPFKIEYNPILNDNYIAGFYTKNKNFIIFNDQTGDLEFNFNGRVNIGSKGNQAFKSLGKTSIDGTEGLTLGDGSNGGLIIIAQLTQKLNQLVQEIETLKAQLNTHTHGTSQGSTTPPVTPFTQTITPFNQTDYEDTHTVH